MGRIKDVFADKIQKLKIIYNHWKKNNFVDTTTPMYWFSMLLLAIMEASVGGRIIRPLWLGYISVLLIYLIIAIIIRAIVVKLCKVLVGKNPQNLISIFLIIAISIRLVQKCAISVKEYKMAIIGLVIGLIVMMTLKSLWSIFIGKVRTRFNIFLGIIGIGLSCFIVGIFKGPGFEDSYIRTYLKLNPKTQWLTNEKKREFQEAIQGGKYTVLSATYGMEDEDITSQTVSLTTYASNKGLKGYIKEKYQGYGLNEVPLRGKIWYPKEVKICPTLFIVHGNHEYIEESYLGYEYLGAYLASYGYVVISVDENACNVLTNENDARAILLLENMLFVQELNENPESPLYNKMDYDELALAGHSRGGEAITLAYLFNQEDVLPNNGKIELNYDFNIKSLIAIAPTVDQYKPTSRSVELTDVNYLVLHGANDQDITQFIGMKQYYNIHFTGQGDYIKSALYCAGCNHGQFNSSWGVYDMQGMAQRVLNVKSFINEAEQQDIAKIFIKIFLDSTINNDQRNIGLLKNYDAYIEYLPETLYVQTYQTSDEKILCDFDEDTSLKSGTMEGVKLDARNVNIWTEGLYPAESSSSGNAAAYLSWTNKESPSFVVSMPKIDMSGATLQFDIMNLKENFKEYEASLLDAQIILMDSLGQQAVISMSEYEPIYPAFLVRLNKFQYLLGEVQYKHQFQTVSIPISSFETKNRALNSTEITQLKIVFKDASGEVAIDQIAY